VKNALKSEFRKLLTVRSTYIVVGLALALLAFIGFYAEGIRLPAEALHDPFQLSGDITGAVQAMAGFGAIVAILLLSHEYRYNTITYTLTASNSRSKVLLAKIVVISVFAVLFTLVVAAFSPLMSYLGVHAHGQSLVPQHIYYHDLWWRVLLYGWGYAMLGLLLTALIRNQVGAIAALFLIPGVVEQLLTLLLKDNAVYLPFSSLMSVLNHTERGAISYGHAALTFMAYMVVGWAITWVLFLRRDAS
jgi:ABC-2 type transport system permease protein